MGKKPKIADPMAPVRANPAKVTHLELNPAGSRNAGKGWFDPLPAFPDEIVACKNLVTLDIFRGLSDGTIPPAIGKLTKLTYLGLGGLDTKVLPEELGKLTKLEHLSLAYMESLAQLPASIGKLTKLVDLQAPYAGITSLPAMGTLKKLATANFANTQLASVDPSLWDCTALESLVFPETLKGLPPGIAKLKKLRELSLSPQALASIAPELPKLKLVSLHVRGDKGAALPAELGEIATLARLDIGYLELTSLPPTITGLANLVELELSGNKLSTVIDTALAFPKLKRLDYSGNPVAVAERRELDKLMKLPPSKRKAAKPAPKVKARPKTKLQPIGQVASVNASLSLIIADAKVAKAWTGVGTDEESDWERACVALAKKDYAMLDVGGQSAVALSLGVGQGIANVFRIGERVVVVESIADNTEDELFLEYVASVSQKPKSVANLAVPSKKLVLVATTDAGDSDDSLTLDVPAKVSITIEPETASSWGRARRFFVSPV